MNWVRTLQARNFQHPGGILWPREGDPEEGEDPGREKAQAGKSRYSYEGQTLLPGKPWGEVPPFFITSPGGWATPILSATCPLLFQVSLWPKIFWVRREAQGFPFMLHSWSQHSDAGNWLFIPCRSPCIKIIPEESDSMSCSALSVLGFNLRNAYLIHKYTRYNWSQSISGLGCAYSTSII